MINTTALACYQHNIKLLHGNNNTALGPSSPPYKKEELKVLKYYADVTRRGYVALKYERN
jgi:hypothetical protein